MMQLNIIVDAMGMCHMIGVFYTTVLKESIARLKLSLIGVLHCPFYECLCASWAAASIMEA